MSLFDVLAEVAEEELVKLRQEKERKEQNCVAEEPYMWLFEAFAEVAAEELVKLGEEDKEKKEPIRRCRSKRTRRQNFGKINVVGCQDHGDDDNTATHDNGGNANAGVESKPQEHRLEVELKLKISVAGTQVDEDAGEINEGKTEQVNNVPRPLPDSPTKFTNKGMKTKTDNVDNGPNPSPQDMPRKLKNKTRKPEPDNGNNPPPALPAEFKNKILNRAQGRKVEEEVLVIQKTLTTTDLSSHQNRFSIPVNQMRNKFLSEEDENFLKERDAAGHCNVIKAGVIEAEGKVENVNLTRWVMKKSSGKHSISYVLNGDGWKNIKSANNLEVGDAVQLWAVQIEGNICFVFVKL